MFIMLNRRQRNCCLSGHRLARYFSHSLGHGVGLEVHEAPSLSKTNTTLLKKGMIVTVEPGIYVPEWGGIRLENMIEVTQDGDNVLNTLSYDDYLI